MSSVCLRTPLGLDLWAAVENTHNQVRRRIPRGRKARYSDVLEPLVSLEGLEETNGANLVNQNWIMAHANPLMAGALGPVNSAIASTIFSSRASPVFDINFETEAQSRCRSGRPFRSSRGKDTTVQTCHSAAAHSSDYFFLPREFRPERHLPPTHRRSLCSAISL
ncbi:hypothetical protein Cob_v000407 [Colletotrichum orbiculare MAFF 240422]|uniref:Uncharacterized protein n=1 Tax=Colletotrichum orbiculare (strain 104-T / ATCC 96160 / CBS 514.97 / LARS 414 / MAFF 240422) TaxID=1213857 RepID=A0A484G5M5_COLOR|nr:hypothetical protein Cob_v000407 [Colletotrichum orbiculare MAFF 240422]